MIEKKIPVKAGIHTLTTYSAHADQQMLGRLLPWHCKKLLNAILGNNLQSLHELAHFNRKRILSNEYDNMEVLP